MSSTVAEALDRLLQIRDAVYDGQGSLAFERENTLLWRQLNQRLLVMPGERTLLYARALTLDNASTLAARGDKLQSAIRFAQSARRLYVQLGDRHSAARLVIAESMSHLRLGNAQRARHSIRSNASSLIGLSRGDIGLEIATRLSNASELEGDYDTALAILNRARTTHLTEAHEHLGVQAARHFDRCRLLLATNAPVSAVEADLFEGRRRLEGSFGTHPYFAYRYFLHLTEYYIRTGDTHAQEAIRLAADYQRRYGFSSATLVRLYNRLVGDKRHAAPIHNM